jgi:hypothetical protein
MSPDTVRLIDRAHAAIAEAARTCDEVADNLGFSRALKGRVKETWSRIERARSRFESILEGRRRSGNSTSNAQPGTSGGSPGSIYRPHPRLAVRARPAGSELSRPMASDHSSHRGLLRDVGESR